MLDEDIRITILQLHAAGHGTRTIANAVKRSRNAVRDVIRSGERSVPALDRAELLDPHLELVRELYVACKGNVVRVAEELELRQVKVAYSTLTAFCRKNGIGRKSKTRAGQYHFAPGEEMQHDTSPHDVTIDGRNRRVQCASLVLCYSRKIFFQIYPRFTRFECRVFLTDALQYFGGSAGRCMIDNTSVLIAKGSGADAVPAPQMQAFAKHFDFEIVAHEPGDKDRSARVERPFHWIENNFYVGRTFASFEDLNTQAIEWCERANAKKKRYVGIPNELFAAEFPALRRLPIHVPDVYQIHKRTGDAEGYAHLDANRYSLPEDFIDRAVILHEYKDRICIYDGPRKLCEHPRIEPRVGKRHTLPEHVHPGSKVSRRMRPLPFEDDLRAASDSIAALVDALKKHHGGRAARPLRHLQQLFIDYPTDILDDAVGTALEYGLIDLHRLENMVLERIAGDFFRLPTHSPHEDNDG